MVCEARRAVGAKGFKITICGLEGGRGKALNQPPKARTEAQNSSCSKELSLHRVRPQKDCGCTIHLGRMLKIPAAPKPFARNFGKGILAGDMVISCVGRELGDSSSQKAGHRMTKSLFGEFWQMVGRGLKPPGFCGSPMIPRLKSRGN